MPNTVALANAAVGDLHRVKWFCKGHERHAAAVSQRHLLTQPNDRPQVGQPLARVPDAMVFWSPGGKGGEGGSGGGQIPAECGAAFLNSYLEKHSTLHASEGRFIAAQVQNASRKHKDAYIHFNCTTMHAHLHCSNSPSSNLPSSQREQHVMWLAAQLRRGRRR